MIDNDRIQQMLDSGMTKSAIEAEIEREGGRIVDTGRGSELRLVTAEDVEFVHEQANGPESEQDPEELVSVWIPMAFYAAKGTINDFDVVLLHVVAHDPNTKNDGAFVLAISREEALDLRDKLNAVGATVSPIKAQIKRRTDAINAEENK